MIISLLLVKIKNVRYLKCYSRNCNRLFVIISFFIIVFYSLIAYRHNKDWKDEITLFSREAKNTTDDALPAPLIYSTLGAVYFENNMYNRAIDSFFKALSVMGELNDVHAIKKDISFKINELDNILDKYYADPDKVAGYGLIEETYYNLGLVYQQKKELDLAEYFYKKAIFINPLSVKAHNNLGIVFAKKKLYGKAAQEFQRALKIDSNYQEAMDNLETVKSITDR